MRGGIPAIALRIQQTHGIFDGDYPAAATPSRGLPIGLRLAVIVASGLIGWAIILGPLYLLW